jgi:HEAT repeat protein
MKSTKHNKKGRSRPKSFSRLPKEAQNIEASRRVKAIEVKEPADDPTALVAMIRSLSDKDPMARVTAIEKLVASIGERGIPHLVDKLADSDSEVRIAAVEGLGDLLRDKGSSRLLIKGLNDRNELVRVTVAEALETIGDRQALPALRKALRDRSPLVRSYVAAAIGSLGDTRDVSRLRRSAQSDKSETARVGIYHGLYLLGQHDILSELLPLLQSRWYKVRCATANTLSEMLGDGSERELIVRRLRRALNKEPTIAARSSIRSTLRKAGQFRARSSAT